MTESEAKKTAKRLKEYWAARGIKIDVHVVAERLSDETIRALGQRHRDLYSVRSNLRNGLPRKRPDTHGLPVIRRRPSVQA